MTIQFRDTFNKGSFMIIGICGLIGSGKGTVADFLVEHQGFTKISFADKLKDGVASVFDWDREMLEGKTPESRAWREKVDPYWSTETGNPITPVIKISTNSILKLKMSDIIDFDCGTIISEKRNIKEVGDELLEYIITVASGEKTTKAAQLEQHDFIPWKQDISL